MSLVFATISLASKLFCDFLCLFCCLTQQILWSCLYIFSILWFLLSNTGNAMTSEINQHQYSTYDSVTAMLSNLGWRSLEYHRYDLQLVMFYKIEYGLVAMQMLSYFEHPKRITRHSQYNPPGFRQVIARTDYYRCHRCLYYLMTIVLWNWLSAQIVLLPDLDSSKREVSTLRSTIQCHREILFLACF